MFATRLLRGVKLSTGLTGIAVNPAARAELTELYRNTLLELLKLPDVEYRRSVEKITRHRLAIALEGPDDNTIEARIGAGQVEELLIQAKDEMSLLQKMKEWKPWEPLAEKPPQNQWR